MEEKRSMEWNKEHGKNCKSISLGNFDKHLTYVSAGSLYGQGLRGRPSKGQIWVLGLARHEGKGIPGGCPPPVKGVTKTSVIGVGGRRVAQSSPREGASAG